LLRFCFGSGNTAPTASLSPDLAERLDLLFGRLILGIVMDPVAVVANVPEADVDEPVGQCRRIIYVAPSPSG
jgi:hypothetical protein